MKTIIRILLGCAVAFLCFICVNSVTTPIKFEKVRAEREPAVIKNLVALRTAENEFRMQNGRFTANLDSLILFVKTGTKKEVVKEGALTDKQLEDGLTELKAVRMIQKAQKTGNWKEVKEAGLEGFKRDTISAPLLSSLYKGAYDEKTIEEIVYVPYSNGKKYEVLVNDNYSTAQGIRVPLVEVRAAFDIWMADQDAQELVNLNDKEEQLGHFAGLRFGNIDEPNNNAGNWE
ncbi:MAG: hypothetical protein ACI4AW_02150 [Paludibacteraceae bacterium]|nr:hypothetical protein [Bacteroidales bacterium]